MGWDQGSQARDLGSLVVGSVSVVLQVIRDSFPTELRKNALMGRTCPRLTAQLLSCALV